MSERDLAEDRKKFEPMRPSWTVSLQLNLGAYIGEWDENLRLTEEQKERSEKYAILYEGFDLGEARRIFAAYQAGAERGAAPAPDDFVRSWYEVMKAGDPYHFAEHDGDGFDCYPEYEIFANSPMVKTAMNLLAQKALEG